MPPAATCDPRFLGRDTDVSSGHLPTLHCVAGSLCVCELLSSSAKESSAEYPTGTDSRCARVYAEKLTVSMEDACVLIGGPCPVRYIKE